jgi:hypothetical protein
VAVNASGTNDEPREPRGRSEQPLRRVVRTRRGRRASGGHPVDEADSEQVDGRAATQDRRRAVDAPYLLPSRPPLYDATGHSPTLLREHGFRRRSTLHSQGRRASPERLGFGERSEWGVCEATFASVREEVFG